MRPRTRCSSSLGAGFHAQSRAAIANCARRRWHRYVTGAHLSLQMDAELEKLVDAGKLTTKSAGQLEKLKPGTFCLHKSWGFGRVREWNLLLNQIVIDFVTKKSHPMQAQYAAENLMPLAPEHFLARKATDLASIKSLARENPAELVRNILES